MKVYFSASIKQRAELFSEYQSIMHTITVLDHTLITAFDILNEPLGTVTQQSSKEQGKYVQRWKQVIAGADLGVFETSFPSTVNVGMEVASFLERGKPVLCLYKQGRDPIFLNEFHNLRLIKTEYSLETLADGLSWAFEELELLVNRRFTFFITPEIDLYLEQISKEEAIPRSEYLRKLIIEDQFRHQK